MLVFKLVNWLLVNCSVSQSWISVAFVCVRAGKRRKDNEFVENCKVKFEICVEDLTFNVSYCCWKILVFFLAG